MFSKIKSTSTLHPDAAFIYINIEYRIFNFTLYRIEERVENRLDINNFFNPLK
jgi:hypothetical protein